MKRIFRYITGTKKRVYILVLLIISALVLSYLGYGSTTPDIAYFEAEKGEFIIDIKTTGELQAHQSISIKAPSGRRRWSRLQIIKMAPEGSIVKKGDFLIQFDTSDLEKELDSKLDELSNAKADLRSIKANQESNMAQLVAAFESQKYSHQLQKINLEKMKYEAEVRQEEAKLNMKKADIALEQAKEKIEAQKIIDKAELKKAELKVKQIQLEIDKIKEQIQSATITAPEGGLVVYEKIWGPNGRQKVKVGDTPWSGQAIMSIPDLSTMQVKTQVNEVDISRVRTEQEVIINLDALPDLTYYGTVTEVANLARSKTENTESNVKVFDVIVTIENTDENIKPGMSASCTIITDKIDSVVYVPLTSVFEKEGKTVVYVMDPSPKEREVAVGSKNSNFIIIKKGIMPGEKVTLRDPTLPLEELGTSPKEKPSRSKPKSSGERTIIRIG